MREKVSVSNPNRPTRSTDHDPARSQAATSSAWPGMRNRLALVGVALMLLSLLAGGVSVTHLETHDAIKIIAVAIFVCSMVALAIGMVGDDRRE